MLDPVTLDQMRVFVAVAEAGTFRGAAARLSRAQSAISHAIGALEAQLGVTLFDRSDRRPALTPAGRDLLADMRAILLKVDTLRARARGLGQGVELRLAVALDPQFPLPIVVEALGAVRAAYPTLGVETWTAPLGVAIASLRERRCTIAITGADIPDDTIELERLWVLRRAAVASPDHPLAMHARTGALLSRMELADHLQIVVPDPSLLTEGQDFGVLSPGTWRTSDNETKRAMIRAGIGWGSLPLWLVEEDLASGRLVRLPVAEFGPDGETIVQVYFARRADQSLGPAARLLRSTLKQRLAALDPAAMQPAS